MSVISEEDMEFFLEVQSISSVINSVSLALSIALALLIGTSYIMKFRATERLSFRLYFFIALADILTHAPLLVDFNSDKITCQIVNTTVFFANIFSVSITTVMALNLHLVFLLDRAHFVRSGRFYVATCFLLSLLICVPSTVLGFMNPIDCPFYLRFEPPFDILAMFGLFGVWILVPTLYCFYVFLSIIIKININTHTSNGSSTGTSDSKAGKLQLKRMVARLVLYPLVPVITVLPYLVSVSVVNKYVVPTRVDIFFQFLCATIQGSLNFFFFLFDPALPLFWLDVKDRVINLTYLLRAKPTKTTRHATQLSDCTTSNPNHGTPLKIILEDLNKKASLDNSFVEDNENLNYKSESIEMGFPIRDEYAQFPPDTPDKILLV